VEHIQGEGAVWIDVLPLEGCSQVKIRALGRPLVSIRDSYDIPDEVSRGPGPAAQVARRGLGVWGATEQKTGLSNGC
jgi:hypothetical protein